MQVLKHTVFMARTAQQVAEHLAKPYPRHQFGEKRWLCQVYLGQDRRIHYEVSRPWSRSGRQLEIGLHLESRTKGLNRELLARLDPYVHQIRAELGQVVYAEFWDRGWAKVYYSHPDAPLTPDLVSQTAQGLVTFIEVVQPIYQHIR